MISLLKNNDSTNLLRANNSILENSYQVSFRESSRLNQEYEFAEGISIRGYDCPPGYSYIYGTEYDDILKGTHCDNIMLGYEGSDIIFGYSGNDILLGGNNLEGQYDILHGGLGDDYLSFTNGDGNIAYGGEGDDKIYGGDGSDTLYGGDGDDFIYTGDNNSMDFVYAGSGNDRIFGGDGLDVIFTEDGDDIIYMGDDSTEADIVFSGKGDDLIHGGCFIFADEGDDNIFLYEIEGQRYQSVNTGKGNDNVVGSEGADLIFGMEGDDTLTGNGGADIFYFFNGLVRNSSSEHGEDIIKDFTAEDEIRFSNFGNSDEVAGIDSEAPGVPYFDIDTYGPTNLSLSENSIGTVINYNLGTVTLEGIFVISDNIDYNIEYGPIDDIFTLV